MGFEIRRCIKLAICCSETQGTCILCSVLCIPLAPWGNLGLKNTGRGGRWRARAPSHPIISQGERSFSPHYSRQQGLRRGCGPTKCPVLGQMLLPSHVAIATLSEFSLVLWYPLKWHKMKEQCGLMQEHCTLYFVLFPAPNSPLCCSPFAGHCRTLGWWLQTTSHSESSFWR